MKGNHVYGYPEGYRPSVGFSRNPHGVLEADGLQWTPVGIHRPMLIWARGAFRDLVGGCHVTMHST